MSIAPKAPSAVDVAELRKYWAWFLGLGIVMVLLGTFALTWACMTTITLAGTWIFGVVLLASGITEIGNVFWSGRWGGHALAPVARRVVPAGGSDRDGPPVASRH